jgi:ParB-like chromosome segregation protein Spo0J
MASRKAKTIIEKIRKNIEEVKELPEEERIEAVNEIRAEIKKVSPFEDPVDLVKWVPAEQVIANEYNPNRVAPPEMKLLQLSIEEDGFTQPIVVYAEDGYYTVVDGFHRNRVGKECQEINQKIHNHLPVVIIDKPLEERMASTIRHNRARGTHAIAPMSKVVEELYFLGWSDKKIAQQLGMEKDEVLRFKQFTGLGNLFKNRKFSKAWR